MVEARIEPTLQERIDDLEAWLYGAHPIGIDPGPLEAASDELEALLRERDGDGPNF